jgi:hypothetical protein
VNLKETQKLLYLERMLNLYEQFTRAYSQVSVEVIVKDKGWVYISHKVLDPYTNKSVDIQKGTRDVLFEPTRFVRVTYHGARFNFYVCQFIEFPVSHLPKRIIHYKRKLKTAFKNRHK